jgi:hypothetical protein
VESYLSGEKSFVKHQFVRSGLNCRFHQQFVVISDNYYGKILCRISISRSSFEMLFQLFSLRSLLNVTSAVRQASNGHPGLKNVSVIVCCTGAKSAPSLCPFLLENACVLLMGVLSTFLVSWLGKEAMAGVGWPIALTW